jgi:hypothetical protein
MQTWREKIGTLKEHECGSMLKMNMMGMPPGTSKKAMRMDMDLRGKIGSRLVAIY